MSPEKNITIGVTGHRNLTPEQVTAIAPLIKRAIDNIIFFYKSQYNTTPFVICTSAIAEGADSLFAKIVVEEMNYPLRIVLPFEKEEYIKDFSSSESRNEFEALLKHKNVTAVEVAGSYNGNNRSELYLNAGKKMVDENEFIIAIWNEEGAAGAGGTGILWNMQ